MSGFQSTKSTKHLAGDVETPRGPVSELGQLGSVPACAARPIYLQERTTVGRAGDQPCVCVGERLAAQRISSNHGNFVEELCVRQHQFDRGTPGGGLRAAICRQSNCFSARPVPYPIRRETVPMPTPCSRAMVRMLLPAVRAARIVHTLAMSSATVAGRPSRVLSAFPHDSVGGEQLGFAGRTREN